MKGALLLSDLVLLDLRDPDRCECELTLEWRLYALLSCIFSYFWLRLADSWSMSILDFAMLLETFDTRFIRVAAILSTTIF